MKSHVEMDLDAIRQTLLVMASRAESAVKQSVEALFKRSRDLAVRVKDSDQVIDQYEIKIDEMAIQHLTKAPLATDLRFITVAMKISQNLERIGDEATKIARRASDLAKEPPLNLHLDLPRMVSLSVAMMKDALDAFVTGDSNKAREIIPRDRAVDALNREVQQALVRHMTKTPDTVMRCLDWVVASKSLERIADHAKNIAEEVIYLYEAENVRHLPKTDF
jgi:phosphate transport system protein